MSAVVPLKERKRERKEEMVEGEGRKRREESGDEMNGQ
jgi:hypothetical protein